MCFRLFGGVVTAFIDFDNVSEANFISGSTFLLDASLFIFALLTIRKLHCLLLENQWFWGAEGVLKPKKILSLKSFMRNFKAAVYWYLL